VNTLVVINYTLTITLFETDKKLKGVPQMLPYGGVQCVRRFTEIVFGNLVNHARQLY
jgi:hypothetical protein